ncbi:glycosyltransferase [Weeksellaceae bacterium KMM 9724]|uniref:glycosyltransferase n=1 Tax=Profundicola chukchiensis TaxID=2961959 RepID=UPI00243F472A|nr:glycosyltransferase [Profundicola chukchiensis]MDG4949422.1 glycosyltransferase [Profundicola chukchiensis]
MKKIIVLICHYNNLKDLEVSLLSIQEDFDVDVLIIDDGSVQKPNLEHLQSIYKNGKIFLELLPKNMGVGKATNIGLQKIISMGYQYTGRLDCGDKNHKNRYKKQLSYLQQNPDVKILGTWGNMVDLQGNLLFVLRHPVSYEKIRKKIYLNSTFINSATIYEVDILREIGLFPEKYHRNGEDYAFYFNAIQHFKAENLPEVLLDYEINPNSLSAKGRKEQVNARISIIKDHFYFGFYPIYGLFRNSLLKLIPQDFILTLKKILKR